ncbi:hypothetical protein BB559_004615 [Furculomyces boomerangus]|uniref:Uncharacterized protein n=1 Tax=Furculomyces boomerangus TaxID=61424 RepID=A0A2T9YDR9_9FUNG|nr:hypothetical protein BB559_004615 [Furculomyces boomerangus]
MFSRLIKNSSFKEHIIVRRFASESQNKTSAFKPQEIASAAFSSIDFAIKMLPKSITGPLCKTASFFSAAIYQGQVGWNVLKLVAKHQGYRIPTKADFTAFESRLFSLYKGLKPSQINKELKNTTPASLKKAGIVTGELVSLFLIGEMIGRGKIIGYKY